ncbi:MAG: hypothetical protein C4K49_06085 [Candidatus Thorarchaeota archaeon]|nr:MAG: hypothetical protein C4K49_06085 [Candidatus Thorarchaeota archaeon]
MDRVKAAGVFIACALILVAIAVQPALANPGTRRDSLISFLSNRYDAAEGGYSLTGETVSRIESTEAAAMILNDLGYLDARPPMIDLVKMKNFTQKLQWMSGGESHERYGGFASYIAGPTSVENTHLALQLWTILSNQSNIPRIDQVVMNVTAALMYINKTQTSLGGFGAATGSSPDVISTYHALWSLNSLFGLKSDETWEKWLRNRTATVEWILSCRVGDSFKLSPGSTVTGLEPTAAAILALDILGELPSVSGLDGIKNWILGRQVTEPIRGEFEGGFEEGYLTNDTNLVSTYYALTSLVALGFLSQCNETAVAQFIIDSQAADGSWGSVPGISVGTLPNAALAVNSLLILGQTGLLLEEDPNNPNAPLLDWRVLVVAGILIVAIAAALVAMRMD